VTPIKGEVWVVELDPVRGSEQGKTRPCLVVSHDQLNTKMPLSIVVPFTGQPHYTKNGKLSPAMVEIRPPEGGLSKISYSKAFQVRSLAHDRFRSRLGVVSPATLQAVIESVCKLIEN
jgi:mRNA interferase MazF